MKDKGIKVSPNHGVNPSVMLCFWCGESKGIALLGKLPNDEEAPREAIYDYDPCDKCTEIMASGITFMEADEDRQPTGRWAVVNEDAVIAQTTDVDILNAVLKTRKAFVLHEDFVRLFPMNKED